MGFFDDFLGKIKLMPEEEDFDEDMIAELLRLKWWDLSENILKENIRFFQTSDISKEDLQKLINTIKHYHD